MDGLPGMRRGVETARKENVKPIKKMVGPYKEMVNMLRHQRAKTVPASWNLVIIALSSFCLGIVAMLLAQSLRI